MTNKIIDEFTDLPISRQRKYQLRQQRDHRCTECGQPITVGSRCLTHLVKSRERQRQQRGLRRRYFNTLGYQLALAETLKTAAGQASTVNWSPKAFDRGSMKWRQQPTELASRRKPRLKAAAKTN